MSRKERIRLLHVITSLYRGGAENHLLALTKAMNRTRFDITVAYMQPYHHLAPAFEALGVQVYPLNTETWLSPRSLYRLSDLIRTGGYDIVHSHLYPAEIYTFVAGLIHHPPIWVASWHNEPLFLQKHVHKQLSRLMYHQQSGVIAISNSVSRYYSEMCKITDDKVRVIHYGIEVSSSQGLPEERVRSALELSPDDFVIIIIARLVPQKNHETALHALHYLRDRAPNVKFLVVGEGPLERHLKRMAVDLGIADHVFFLGFQNDVRPLLAISDVLLLCSHYEGFGLVLLEAMSHAKSVIASNVGPLPEIVLDGETGLLVPPTDVEAVAQAVLALYCDRAHAKDMGQRGFQRLQKQFTAERMAAETEAFYLGLLY